MNYTRNCGKCNRIITHSHEQALMRAIKRGTLCRPCSKKKPVLLNVTERLCPKCNQTKDSSAFARDSSKRDGLQCYCKQCNNIHFKDYIYPKYKERYNLQSKNNRKRIKERLNELKSVPCMDCGQSYDPICMDFDHLPQYTKSFNISNFLREGNNWARIKEEITKCEIVCSNCHRLRSKRRILEKQT